MRIRAALGNVALVLGSLAVCAVFVEVGARLHARAAAAPAAGPARPISRYHPKLGWDKPPGGEQRIDRDEYDVVVSINSKGLRSPETSYEKPTGTRRVLIVGDSFAEGYYVEEPQTARAVLEGLLNGPGACQRHEVINGGTAGYSTDQEYLFFLEEGHRYAPDVVLVFFYYNDLYYNTSAIGTGGKPKPYFAEEDRRLALRNVPVPRLPEGRRGRGPRPWRGSVALRLLGNRTSERNPALHEALARVGLVEPISREPFREFWVFGIAHKEDVDAMWTRTAALLRAFEQDVAARGGRLAVVYVPSRMEINEEAFTATSERYRMGLKKNRDRVVSRLARTCESLGLPLLDPREALRAAEAAGRLAYFPSDGHWNEAGNAVVGQELAPFVRTLVPCPAVPSAGSR